VIDYLRDKYSVSFLCQLLKCSKSGYYDWINLGRPQYKRYIETVANVINDQYLTDTRQGITSLKMNVKAVYQLLLTKKRIYRYMLLLNIRSITARKPKRYGRVKHHSIPNLLKRDFTSTGPNQKWSIDVTYILTTEGVEYLCAVKDLHDKSIIAYSQSRFNDNRLVLTTVEAAIASVPAEQRLNLILHSDQGVQFTSKEYSQLLNTHHIHHSVSFKGSCVDNVPIESWFSLLKCECLYMVKNLTRVLSRRLVSEYVDYYNHRRLQEQLKELAPIHYRSLALQ
jgi:transposase InsO family protein